MTPDAAGARRSPGDEHPDGRATATTASALAVVLLAVAFLGAATAGVLGTVGPYLLGVSALVLALFVLGRR